MLRPTTIASFPLLLVAIPYAQDSPFRAAHPPMPKLVRASGGTASGGFLGGADDCNAPHTSAGTGDQSGVPFVTGTTGSAGQNEALCYAFGQAGIDSDVWFDWTADESGQARLTTCAGTSVDTKVAVWPLAAGCPTDGTALACNDDACGLQSSVSWSVSPGQGFTLQIGTFPGAAGGAGTFDLIQSPPPPCGTYDDGTSENALGLIAGGEIGWLHFQDCLQTVNTIATAYGTPTGAPPPGPACSRVACYEDPDCDGDPTTPPGGLTLMWSVSTYVHNAGTDILNPIPYPGDMGGSFTNVAMSGCTFVLASANQAPGEFPAPMDQTNPTLNAWVVGNTLGPTTLDLSDLSNNTVAPLQTTAAGFPTAWLLRASSSISGPVPPNPHHVSLCFGGSNCPCNNSSPGPGRGCANSTGQGARLSADGCPGLSCDGLVLAVQGTPNQPGIFFQGNESLHPFPTFGDGLRCVGANVVRIGTYLPSGHTVDTATGNLIGGIGPPISLLPGNAALGAGDTRYYQWWYRDPVGGPCGNGFNLSNAVRVEWID